MDFVLTNVSSLTVLSLERIFCPMDQHTVCDIHQTETNLNVVKRLLQYHDYAKVLPFQEVSMNYVTRIRNLREDSDKTQQEIAEVLGTSQTMYARYERGANEMPIRHLLKLAEYYNVSMDYLCGLTNRKFPYPR